MNKLAPHLLSKPAPILNSQQVFSYDALLQVKGQHYQAKRGVEFEQWPLKAIDSGVCLSAYHNFSFLQSEFSS